MPLYDGMTAAWAADGVSQDTLDFAAAAILGPGADEAAWKEHWSRSPKYRAPQLMHPLTTRDDITGRLAEITCPALVVHGELDASIPVEKARALVEGVAGCRAARRSAGRRSRREPHSPRRGQPDTACLPRQPHLTIATRTAGTSSRSPTSPARATPATPRSSPASSSEPGLQLQRQTLSTARRSRLAHGLR